MARKATFDRAAVLDKAMTLFWAKGYHATSLRDLEAALDLRPGSIYAAFGSKEALFGEALAAYARTSRAAYADAVAGAPSALAGLAAHVRALGRSLAAGPPARACMLVKTLLETPDDDPGPRRRAEDLIRETEAGFAAAFRAARDAGDIPADSDPALLAARLQAEIFGLRAYAQRTDAADRIPALAEAIARDLERLAA
jgi:AcrR family transcriptional regulator